MRFYLDTSAIVSIFIEEARTISVVGLVRSLTEKVLISDLGIGEFSAAVSTAFRTERQSQAEAMEALADFDGWSLERAQALLVARDDIATATGLVRRFELKLLFPDALHLAVCARADAHLITGDHRQAKAADALGIPVTLV